MQVTHCRQKNKVGLSFANHAAGHWIGTVPLRTATCQPPICAVSSTRLCSFAGTVCLAYHPPYPYSSVLIRTSPYCNVPTTNPRLEPVISPTGNQERSCTAGRVLPRSPQGECTGVLDPSGDNCKARSGKARSLRVQKNSRHRATRFCEVMCGDFAFCKERYEGVYDRTRPNE